MALVSEFAAKIWSFTGSPVADPSPAPVAVAFGCS